MLLRDNELARRQDGAVELRPGPLRARWTFDSFLTRDGHELDAVFTCSVRALPDATERRMLEEVLLGSRYALSVDDVADHLKPALKAAGERVAAAHSAEECTADPARTALLGAFRDAAGRVAFGCGVELLPPFQLDLHSPTYHRQQLLAKQQALAEQQTAGRIEHVHRTAELLRQFEGLRRAAPELSPGRVLQQISPGDRGAVFQALLMASSPEGRADTLWAVSGPYLVRIDIQDRFSRPTLYALPTSLGPLRSVSAADVEGVRQLLVGARSGFLRVDENDPSDAQTYRDEAVESPLGFNRVLYWERKRHFAASHGDAGIVCWEPDRTDAPVSALRPERFLPKPAVETSDSGGARNAGPRNLQVLDEATLVFSAGTGLYATDARTVRPLPTESSAEVDAVLPDGSDLLVVHEDGTLCRLDRATRQTTCLSRRGAHVRSAGLLPWLGTGRLLLAGEAGPIDCIGFDDPLVTQYQSAHRGLRAVTGSASRVAAISADRQRLIFWNAWDDRQPLAELHLTGLTRHRIADVSFG